MNRFGVPGSVKYQQVAEDHQQDHNLKDDQVDDEIMSKIINHNKCFLIEIINFETQDLNLGA